MPSGTAFSPQFAAFPDTVESTGDIYVTLNRHYFPTTFRWMSPDLLAGSIMNPQSLNRYSYVLGNPANFIDPLGLCAEGLDDYECAWQDYANSVVTVMSSSLVDAYTILALTAPPSGGGLYINGWGAVNGWGSSVGGWGGGTINLPASPLTLGGLLGMPDSVRNCGFVACSGPDLSGMGRFGYQTQVDAHTYYRRSTFFPNRWVLFVDVWERMYPQTELMPLYKAGKLAEGPVNVLAVGLVSVVSLLPMSSPGVVTVVSGTSPWVAVVSREGAFLGTIPHVNIPYGSFMGGRVGIYAESVIAETMHIFGFSYFGYLGKW